MSDNKIRIGISSCLLGQEVRYDGGHKHDRFVTGSLSRYFEFVPVCPEVAIGLGVPREPIQLVGKPGSIRVVGTSNRDLDVTQALRDYGELMAHKLKQISGYILKSRSPSCGMERVKLYPARGQGAPARTGVGQYAAAFMAARPLLPVEEEGRLGDPVLRENFIERIFAFRRWQDLVTQGVTPARLVAFHTRHKLALLAHDRRAYQELGRIVAGAGTGSLTGNATRYVTKLMTALKRPATRKNHTNVLQHIQGYLKSVLDRADKAELVEVIERYRLGQVPLVVPITLLNHHFRRHPDPYIAQQVYLNPHPPELMLRNLI